MMSEALQKAREYEAQYGPRIPGAIAPDMPYDASGCFSGSAIELPDGRQMLMYTGVQRGRDEEE